MKANSKLNLDLAMAPQHGGAQALEELLAGMEPVRLQDEPELNYDPADYPDKHVMIDFVKANLSKEPVRIDPKALSVFGKVKSEPMPRYLNNEAISSSALKQALNTPLAYYFYVNDRSNFAEKPKGHFDLGTFAHLALLEPELYDRVIIEPAFPRNSTEGVDKLIEFWEENIYAKYKYAKNAEKRIEKAKALLSEAGEDLTKLSGKKKYIDCLQEASGLQCVKEEHFLIIDFLKRRRMHACGGLIPALLKGAKAELSTYYTDPDSGLKVKVRPDAINIKENIGVDAVISVKTTSADSLDKFLYDSAKFKYQLSEGMYQNVMSGVTGRKFNTTIMIMLQTVAPFDVAVLWWSADDLENGKYQYRYALDTVKDCAAKGIYPGFDAFAGPNDCGIIDMQQPAWAHRLIPGVEIS